MEITEEHCYVLREQKFKNAANLGNTKVTILLYLQFVIICFHKRVFAVQNFKIMLNIKIPYLITLIIF